MVETNGIQIGILFVVLIAAILSAATLYLVAVREQKPNTDGGVKSLVDTEEPQINCKHSDDVAIIGAGIAGSYAAWRLREAGLKITLYEYSDRIGGRCHTVKFPDIPDINVELGAMRFYPSVHVMLNKTIAELGLETTDFLPHNTDTLYYLRGTHMNRQQLVDDPPYTLKPQHKTSPWTTNWEMFSNFTNVNSSVPGYLEAPHIFQYKTTDGVPLYMQSYKSFHGKYLYPELSAFLEDSSGFSSSRQDVSAAKSIPTSDPNIPLTTRSSVVLTVVDGFQSIPETMVKQFIQSSDMRQDVSAAKSEPAVDPNKPITTESSGVRIVIGGFQSLPETMVQQFIQSSNIHSYRPNHHLKSIKKLEDGRYKLSFQPTQTVRGVTRDKVSGRVNVCAKTVLLAIPRLALEHLDWDVLKGLTTSDYIKNALYEAKAGKIYFAYDNPWWRNVINAAPTIYSTTPLRVTYDFGVSNSTDMAVLNTGYNDVYTRIWRNTLTQGKPVPGVNDDTIQVTDVAQNMARKYLAQIYGISVSDVPQPKYSVMRIWDEYPIGASWYHFRAGYIWTEVEDHMLKPSDVDDVYVISNTFSSTGTQSWTEGALEIVEKMLKKRFPGF